MHMRDSDVELIEYTKPQDALNCLTHSLSAAAGVAVLVMCTAAAVRMGSPRAVVSAVIYGLTLVAIYTASAVYHGLPPGESKRRARLVDHSVIPLLIAGTGTPCAMITLYRLDIRYCIVVMALGWFSVVFGIVSKLFFFKKTKALTVAFYIIACTAMLACSIPVMDSVNTHALFLLVLGCAVYLAGALFCMIGRKRPYFHAVFHVFVAVGSFIHAYVIYVYILV